MDNLAGVSVLVTGGTGFIGSHVVKRLLEDNAEVHVMTSSVSSVYPVRLCALREHITLHGANLNDGWAMDSLLARVRPEVVLHLGAYTHVGKSWNRVDECIQTNIQGTVNLLQACKHSRFQRFVYTSTSEVYGDVPVPFREDGPVRPISPYAVTKYAGELLCHALHEGKGWPIVVVRPFNAFGPAQSPDRVIPEMIVKGLRKERFQMTSGKQTREFNFVEDLAAGFVRAALVPGIEGEVFNIGGGEEITMRDLAKKVLDLMGNPIVPEIGALEDRPTEIWSMRSDSTKAKDRLDLRAPTPLIEGLTRTIEWYRQEIQSPTTSFVV